jgi:5-methylcytosine-specific restriction endonuclease McrA
MICRKVAEVHESEPDSTISIFPLPRVVRLVGYVVNKWRYTSGPAWSRPGVMARDGHRCMYCDAPAGTIDHVLPQSRGGLNTWKNTVAACSSCNQRQGNRTPAEAGMPLRTAVYAPSWAQVAR